MASYTARAMQQDEGIRVDVMSPRCRYTIWFAQGIAILQGPGVNEMSDIEEDWENTDLEVYAINLVTRFEEGLWP